MALSQTNYCGMVIWLAFKDICLARPLSVLTTCIFVLILATLYLLRACRQTQRTTRIRGPQGTSLIFGLAKTVVDSNITNELYEPWAKEYGPVYKIPHALGKYRLMLWDQKAISHFYARDTSLYHHTPFNKIILPIAIGRGVMGADGESHRRQRKNINPTFNAAAVRSLSSIFQDVAHKAVIAWDAEIESNRGDDCAVIDVQQWMNHISLDNAGIGILSHDFGALDGNGSDVEHVLNAFSASVDPSNSLFILGQTFPSIMKLPWPRTKFSQKLHLTVGQICQEMLSRRRKEKETGGTDERDKSCLGLLLKAEESGETVGLTQREVLDEARILLLGAFETTAVSLTWAFIELGRNPDIQTKLRDECLEFGSTPSYDDLTNKLPYLNAVVNEVLRLHSPVVEVPRAVTEDDVIPLSEPLYTADGKFTDNIYIAKGTEVVIPLAALNRSVSMWGPDAKVFKPSRWFKEDEGTHGTGDMPHGYRHLMTFGNGARMCPGRLFALTQFKTVLFILVRHFMFEMADGAEVQIVKSLGLLPRPSVVGSTEAGCSVPLRVRRYEV